LHEIAENYEFSDANEQIRDRLLIGILDRGMSEKLQLRADLTLEKAVEMARQSEMVKSQIKDQSLSNSHVEAVHRNNTGTQAQCQNQYSASNRGVAEDVAILMDHVTVLVEDNLRIRRNVASVIFVTTQVGVSLKGNSFVAVMGMIISRYAAPVLVFMC
jgi:preprotein translocase subunit SecF